MSPRHRKSPTAAAGIAGAIPLTLSGHDHVSVELAATPPVGLMVVCGFDYRPGTIGEAVMQIKIWEDPNGGHLVGRAEDIKGPDYWKTDIAAADAALMMRLVNGLSSMQMLRREEERAKRAVGSVKVEHRTHK